MALDLDGRYTGATLLPDNLTITITAPLEPLAGACVQFNIDSAAMDAIVTRDPADTGFFDRRLHDLDLQWNFGDPGATYTLPTNLHASHRDANVARGMVVGHCFRSAGDYIVSLVIRQRNGAAWDVLGVWQTRVSIGDPDAYFQAANTHYISPSSNTANQPAGSTLRTSVWDALAAIDGQAAPQRIICARGESEVFPDQLDFNGAEFPNIWVETEAGAGANYQITYPESVYPTGTSNRGIFWVRNTGNAFDIDMQWKGVDFVGPWDATTQTSTAADGTVDPCFYFDGSAGLAYAGYVDCAISGWGLTFNFSNNVNMYAFNECDFGEYQDYMLFGGWSRALVMGCKGVQDPDAISGGDKDGFNNNHGWGRINGPSTDGATFIDSCDIFTRTGWFQNIAGYRTMQPCLRWNMNGNPNVMLNLRRNSMEGGYDIVALARTRSDTNLGVQTNTTIEECTFVGTHMTRDFITAVHSGVTVRNNLFIVPDVPRLNGIFDPRSIVNVGETTDEAQSFAVDTGGRMLIEFNTKVNLMRAVNYSDGDEGGGGAFVREVTPGAGVGDPYTIVEQNNIDHGPDRDTPDIPFAPLASAALPWSPRYNGYRDPTTGLDASLATTLGSSAVFYPTTGPAYQTASNPPRRDLLGALRASTANIGAIEAWV